MVAAIFSCRIMSHQLAFAGSTRECFKCAEPLIGLPMTALNWQYQCESGNTLFSHHIYPMLFLSSQSDWGSANDVIVMLTGAFPETQCVPSQFISDMWNNVAPVTKGRDIHWAYNFSLSIIRLSWHGRLIKFSAASNNKDRIQIMLQKIPRALSKHGRIY